MHPKRVRLRLSPTSNRFQAPDAIARSGDKRVFLDEEGAHRRSGLTTPAFCVATPAKTIPVPALTESSVEREFEAA